MADIFISYASKDRDRVIPLVKALEAQGYSVWWDRTIAPGKTFDQVIEEAITAAKCVVVLWSKESIKSAWVKEEADIGKSRQILVPALIGTVKPPLGFGLIQAADLTDYNGESNHAGFQQLIKALTDLLRTPIAQVHISEPPKLEPKEPRPAEAPIDETKLAEPTPSGQKPSLAKPGEKSPATKISVLIGLVVVIVAGAILLFRPGPPKTLTNSIGMEFVLIPAGSFTMGSKTDINEKPPHKVGISHTFYLQTTEVRQGQWKKVMGDNPSKFKDCGEDCPVEQVSWEDAKRFIEKLIEIENTKDYRLPSEAEWEYACQAGSKNEFSFGDDAKRLGEFAWYSENSENITHPVGEKKPNAWGLYDMHGNVREWVEDDWHDSYEGAPVDGQAWVDEPRGSHRVRRGGGWGDHALDCRSAARYGYMPGRNYNNVGFRLSRSISNNP